MRFHCSAQLQALPQGLRSLDTTAQPYRVEISEGLRALARDIDATTS